MALDNPDDGTEMSNEVLETKLRAEADRMTKDAEERAQRPAPEQTEETEQGEETQQPVERRQTPQEPQKHRVKYNGEEIEVTLDELLQNYSRESDYTRKMQALSEDRKRQVDAPKTQYEQLNNQLISRLQAFMPEKPDVAMLNPQSEKYNPDSYHLQRANFEAFQEHLGAAQNEQRRLQGERDQEAKQSQQSRMAEESQKILKAIPEWKDTKAFNEDVTKMKSFLGTQGVSDDDINAWIGSPMFNHVQVKILRLAVQAANATDQKVLAEAKVKDIPPVTKPGAAEVKDTDSAEVQRLKAQVKRNPRDDRAVAALFAAQDRQKTARANRR